MLGWFLWHTAGAVVGDGLFHEARVRKLVDLGDLHLRTVDEFRDGGLHPGYAFPLWHGLDALVAWFSGLDPSVVMRHEGSLLAPIAVAVAYEAGAAVFRSRAGGVTLALAQVALFCFAPGGGGSYAQLSQPANAARQILAPAAIALFFSRNYAATVVVFGALALVHSSYALFMLVPLVVLAYREWRAYLAAAAPVVAVLLWLRPLVKETRSHNPSDVERLRGLQQYADQLVISGPHHFRLAPEVLGRTGAVAIAALFLLPLTALAIRRRWAQYVLGGSLLILLLMEVPWLFVHLVGRGVALAGASRGRVRAAAVRIRRCVRACGAAVRRAPGRARRRASSSRSSGPATSASAFDTAARRSRPGSRWSAACSRSPPSRSCAPAPAARAPPARRRRGGAFRAARSSSTASPTGARRTRATPTRSRRDSSTTCARRCRRGRS